ncbi:TonB-dependent receptor [Thalassotalea sp. PLHSN55]|uniref:TonB-dependent receptor n=1 Tax=Thalassotalea sp. PLHSN55 TaxID=3435888 RepID=UPI003F87703A
MVLTKIKNRPHYQRLLLGAASATALMGSLAQAQETTTEEQQKNAEAIEVIEVKGFRSSLTKSLNMKRLASNIVDGIAAEDIGKSADQNIAEALQRVTGISISRQDGEGTTVSARGVQGSLNVVTLNGVPLSDSSAGGGVNFSEFSSDILSSIEVQKTPSASTDEGSLGASIRLAGFKPLDANKDRRIVEIQGRQNDFADTDDFKAQLSLSEKFLDDTVGFSLVASREEQGTRRDLSTIGRWRTIKPPVGATNMETGEVVRTWDYDGDGVEEPLELRQASVYKLETQTVQRNRDSIAATLQLRPWENGEFKFDATYSSQDIARDTAGIQTTPERVNYESQNIVFDPNTFTIVKTLKTALTQEERVAIAEAEGVAVNQIPGKVRNVGVIRNYRNMVEDNTENKVISFSYDHYFENVDVSIRGGHSETDRTPTDQLQGFFRGSTAASTRESGVQNGYLCNDGSDGLICELQVTPEGYMDNAEGFEYQAFTNSGNYVKDVADSLYADVLWTVDFGAITSIETGLKWSSREKETNRFFSQCNRGCVGGELNDYTLADFTNGSTSGNLGEGIGLPPSEFTDGFPVWDIETTRDFLASEGLDGNLELLFTDIGSKTIQQDVFAGYLQANFELMDGRLTGDFGIRVAQTKVTGMGASAFKYDVNQSFMSAENIEKFGSREAVAEALGILVGDPDDQKTKDTAAVLNTDTHEYTDVLPSFNLNYAVSEDVIVRFAASQTIARPPFDKLAPQFSISEGLFGEYSNGNLGTVKLDPYKSSNLDISAEWYFNKSSLFSVALFTKDLSDYYARVDKKFYWRDIRSEYYDDSTIVDPTTDRAVKKEGENVTFNPIADNVLLSYDDGDNQTGCMPNREIDLLAPTATDFCDVALISGGRNGAGGYVRGAEISFQHNLDYLPGFWSGFGGVMNYTYADSQTDAETFYTPDGELADYIPDTPLENTSEHTFNATAFWEKNGKLVRLAYNYRTDYLINRVESEYGSHWIDGFGTLDLSANWNVTNWASINLQASNLLDTVTRVYSTTRPNVTGSNIPGEATTLGEQPTERTVALSNTGTIYRLGVRLTF